MGHFGDLFQTTHRIDAPVDERDAAKSELFQFLARQVHSADLVPKNELFEGEEYLLTEERRHAGDPHFAKSVILEPTLFAERYPETHAWDRRRAANRAILYVNELGMLGRGAEQWVEKPSSGFDFLQRMALELDFVQATIRTQLRDVQPFLRRYRDDDNNPFGFKWARVDGEKLTKADHTECDRLNTIFENCGTEADPVKRRWVERRSPLYGFVTKLLADSLTADSCPVFLDLSRKGDVLGWRNLDYTTVRLAYEDGYEGNDKIVAVQIVAPTRQPVIGFEQDELIFEVRNPRSSVYLYDYGVAELEHFVRAATSYLNAFARNAAYLDKNSLPRGFLTLFGDFDKRALNDVRTSIRDTIRGASNGFGLPIIVSRTKDSGAVWTPIDTAEHEMLSTKWITFLLSLWCGISGVSPEKIHQESFASRTSSLSGDKTKEKLDSSDDQARVPLVLWLFSFLNSQLVCRLTQKYHLVPVGLFPDDEQQQHELIKLSSTINEVRAITGAEPYESDLIGNAPSNPTLMSLYMQEQGLLQQPGEGGQEGAGEPQDSGLPASEGPLPYARGGENGGPRKPPQRPAAMNGNGNGNGKPAPFAKARVTPPRLVVELRELPPGEPHG